MADFNNDVSLELSFAQFGTFINFVEQNSQVLVMSAKSRALNCTKSKCRKQEQNISLLEWFLVLGKLLWDSIKPLEQGSRASVLGRCLS